MHPVLFEIGSFTIYSYGFFVALAMMSAFFAAQWQAKTLKVSAGTATDLLFVLFVSGVIGARLFYIGQNFGEYQKDFWKIFSLREGGLVWYGGFITAVLAGMVYARARRLLFFKWCDFLAPILALGHGIGRIGCFFNGCCYGRVTAGQRPAGLVAGHLIPIQLYESAALLVLSVYLFYRIRRPHTDGEIFAEYLVFYSASRFVIEFWRGDQIPVASLTIPQWISLFLFVSALAWMISLRKKRPV